MLSVDLAGGVVIEGIGVGASHGVGKKDSVKWWVIVEGIGTGLPIGMRQMVRSHSRRHSAAAALAARSATWPTIFLR